MAAHTPTVDVPHPHHQYQRTLLLVVFGLFAAAALVVAASRLSVPASTVPEGTVSASLFDTATVIEAHGAAMIDHGRRLADTARASTDANRDHWIADGEHMVADGTGMKALAERLRSAARLLGGRPTARAEVDLWALSGEAGALVSEGRSAIEHGRAMVDHAAAMVELAREPTSGISEEDALLMAQDAPHIIEAGERVMGVGQTLRAFVDKMQRSLGR